MLSPRRGWGMSIFIFIFTIANFMLIWNHSKSCTLSCDWGQLTNHYRKTKVRASYNDKVPWGCRRFESWKESATRIPCRSDPGLQEISPMGIELSILRPGLVNQSQEYIENCSTEDLEPLFDSKNIVSLDLAPQEILFIPILHKILCYPRQVPLKSYT